MTVANLLTIARILIIPVFINLLLYGYTAWAFALFVVAGLTDGLDGIVARFSNQRTRLGAYLDPMADKLLLMAAFIALTALGAIPGWLTTIIVSRDLILILSVLILHLTQTRCDMTPSPIGKGTTVIQLLLIAAVLMAAMGKPTMHQILSTHGQWLMPLLFLTLTLTVCSGLHYLYRGIRLINTELS